MREVIARTKKSLFGLYLGCAVFVLAIIGIVLGFCIAFGGIDALVAVLVPCILLVLFAFALCMSVCVRIYRAPENVVVREVDNLILPDGICPLRDLKNVVCRRAGNGYGAHARWGTLILQTAHGEKKYEYVADVEQAHNRLIELMLAAREKEN